MPRLAWVCFGLAFLSIGIVGVAVPLVPTTPFVLLAAACFARGSNRLHAWLNGHPVFGPPLCQWKRNGSKRAAMITMAAVPLVTLLLGVPLYLAGLQCAVLAFPAAFVCSRPLPKGGDGY